MTYDSSVTPDEGGWDMPITGNFPVDEEGREYYEKSIRTAIARLIREECTVFWVYADNHDFSGNPMKSGRYYLYIGY